jgi:hypothetical protein
MSHVDNEDPTLRYRHTCWTNWMSDSYVMSSLLCKRSFSCERPRAWMCSKRDWSGEERGSVVVAAVTPEKFHSVWWCICVGYVVCYLYAKGAFEFACTKIIYSPLHLFCTSSLKSDTKHLTFSYSTHTCTACTKSSTPATIKTSILHLSSSRQQFQFLSCGFSK